MSSKLVAACGRSYPATVLSWRKLPGLIGIVLVSLLADGQAPPKPPAPAPSVGFTFSPKALADGVDEYTALRRLLVRLHPDLVRLPVYWDGVAPDPTTLDFSEVDGLLKVISDYNSRTSHRPSRAILVVGARNVLTPEVHVPWWVDASAELDQVIESQPYQGYLRATFEHYAQHPILYAWQVENEPLDSSNELLGDISLSERSLENEIDALRDLDRVHPIVVTTYNSSHVNLDKAALSRFGWIYETIFGSAVGHPQDALTLGDVLGLDLYVVTPSTPLDQASAEERIAWKAQALRFWSDRAAGLGKDVWVTEMQGGPWATTDGFTTADLLASARAYRDAGASVVLLWGVEQWLQSPGWMTAGRCAISIMRAGGDACSG